MATFYLIDAHTNPVGSSQINEVITAESPATIRVDGNFVVKVPDGVHVADPTDLNDLLTQKYAGILAQYPGFTNIAYDDMLDSTGFTHTSGWPVKFGERGSAAWGHTFGTITSSTVVVGGTVTQAVAVFDFFQYNIVDPKDGTVERYYEELPDPWSGSPMRISVDNNANQSLVTESGVLTVFSPGSQGNQIVVENVSGAVEGLPFSQIGSWALIY